MVTTSQAIQQQIADLARDLNNQVAIQNTYRTTGTKGIQGAYNTLDKQLAQNLADITSTTNQSRSTIQGDYARAGTNISDAERSLREMLGNQGGLQADLATGPLAEIKKLNAERALSEADSLASDKLLGTGYITQAQKARGDARTEGTGQIASLTSQIGADIGEMQRQYLKEKSAAQVQYAQALAEEKYKAEQMALERARLAAENEARRAAAAKESSTYEGRAGVMQWIAENKISPEQATAIMQAIDRSSISGDSGTAYEQLASMVKRHNNSLAKYPRIMSLGDLGKSPFARAKNSIKGGTSWNNMMLNSALDIYFGKYSGAAGERYPGE